MEAAVPWKAALRNARLPTGLGKRFAFPTSPTAPAGDTKERRSRRETHGGVKISRSLGGLILTIVGTCKRFAPIYRRDASARERNS